MVFFPRHRVTRLAATLWLLASVLMLAATLLRPDIHGSDRAALIYLTPLYWLSFPLGHLGVMAGIRLRVELYLSDNLVPSVFAEGLFLWTALTVLGYLQWFVLLPRVADGCRRLSRFLFNRDAAR
ncbi:MAG TPA: hypothetical protein VKD25_09625 [Burkholderiales bacterium]|nr:hypothetical protein [Burkholderiales bacterium]